MSENPICLTSLTDIKLEDNLCHESLHIQTLYVYDTHTHIVCLYVCMFFIAKLTLHINDNVSSCRGSNTLSAVHL